MTRFGIAQDFAHDQPRPCSPRHVVRRPFPGRSRGATAIEYGLMVAPIGIAIMTIVFTVGQDINNTLYGRITNALAAML